MPSRYFLLLFLLAYLGVAFIWRSLKVWQSTGINPVVFKRTDSAHDFIGRVFKLLFALIVIVVAIYSFWPEGYLYFMPITWLERSLIKWLGATLLLVSFLWTVAAQAQMGESWRIGIDDEHPTPLVRNGVYRWSRNPIYVGIVITLIGLLLVIPNALTLMVFAMGLVLIPIQVRLEEEYLSRTHGEDYQQYRRDTRRWI